MATISIPWNTGSGNIVIEYTGEGNGSLLVYSDTENANSEERSQTLNVSTLMGSPQRVVPITIKQGAATTPYLLLESGGCILLEDGGTMELENTFTDK